MNHIHHFVLTPDGGVREISAEQAAGVAAGAGKLPEYADRALPYLQVTIQDESEDQVKVITAGARLKFDHDGRLTEAGPIGDRGPRISHFEHDACVQWALRDLPNTPVVSH